MPRRVLAAIDGAPAMNLPSAAPSVRAPSRRGHFVRIGLLVGVAALVSGADNKQITPRGGDPVQQMMRLLDRGWDPRDPEAADRRRELQLLAREVKNLG